MTLKDIMILLKKMEEDNKWSELRYVNPIGPSENQYVLVQALSLIQHLLFERLISYHQVAYHAFQQ